MSMPSPITTTASPATAATQPNASTHVGATGGPGQTPPSESTGHPDTHKSDNNLVTAALEKEQHRFDREIMEVMIGGSGGTGGIPTTLDEARNMALTPVTAMNLLYDCVFKMSTDGKLKKLLEVNTNSQPNITKAQTYVATVAVQIGMIANLIKKDILMSNCKKNAWTQYRRENLDKHINPNTLSVYMKVASINNVAKHLGLGIDRLGKIATVIENKGMLNDNDPIMRIIDTIENETLASGNSYDFTKKCEAAILHYKVKKAGLDAISMNQILSMLSDGRSLDKKDIDNMLEMKKCGKAYYEYVGKDNHDNSSDVSVEKIENFERSEPKIKDVNSEIAKLSQTVVKALTIPPSKINLDIEKLDILINTLAALRQNFAAIKETPNQ